MGGEFSEQEVQKEANDDKQIKRIGEVYRPDMNSVTKNNSISALVTKNEEA